MNPDTDQVLRDVMAAYAAISPPPPEIVMPAGAAEPRGGRRPTWSSFGVFAASFATVLVVGVVMAMTLGLPEADVAPSVPAAGPAGSSATDSGVAGIDWVPTRFVLEDGTVLAEAASGSVEVAALHDHVVNRAIGRLVELPELGATAAERRVAILGCAPDVDSCSAPDGGLVVTLTIEQDTQRIAAATLDRWIVSNDEQAGEIVIVDNDSGAVTGWVTTGAPGDDGHPAGTLMHTFTTLAALEEGISLASEWDASSPRTFDSTGDPIECINAGESPVEAMELRDALTLSVNTVFCDIVATIGESNVVDVMERLGVASTPGEGSVMLGTNRVDAVAVAGAYGTMAQYGRRVAPEVVASVRSSDGPLVWEAPAGDAQVLPQGLVAATHEVLVEATVSGTATRARIGTPQAGKTGSTLGFVGAWYAGYTPETTAVVWVGNRDGSPLVDVTFGEQTYARVSGGTVPAPMWAELMLELGEDRAAAEFPAEPADTGQFRTG